MVVDNDWFISGLGQYRIVIDISWSALTWINGMGAGRGAVNQPLGHVTTLSKKNCIIDDHKAAKSN